MGKTVRLDIIDIDRYKRMVGVVWIESRNINLEMVQEGYAAAHVEYLKEPYRTPFIQAEKEAYHRYQADRIIAEKKTAGKWLNWSSGRLIQMSHLVTASRDKLTRAEPIAAQYEKGHIHPVGNLNDLENEMCLWIPGDHSPNLMDALVWALTKIMLEEKVIPNIMVLDISDKGSDDDSDFD